MATALQPRVQKYWPNVVTAANAHHQDACFVAAVLDRETACCLTTTPKGPAGTGDWAARLWSRYQMRQEASLAFRHWRPTEEEFRKHFPKHRLAAGELPPEICMPSDGLGWGRGAMQLDYADPTNADFLAKKMPDGSWAWQDAGENITAGAAKLEELVRIFHGDEWLAAAGYNAGAAHVQTALLSLSSPANERQRHAVADGLTTGGNYASDVIGRRELFRRALSVPNPTP